MYNPYEHLSYWEKASFFQASDFTIIGSGIVGLFTAYFIKSKHPNAVVQILEQGLIPMGASTRNAGFACFGSVSEVASDIKNQSLDQVVSLMERRWVGMGLMKEVLGEKNIDFLRCGGYEIFNADEKDIFDACQAQISELNREVARFTGCEESYRVLDDDEFPKGVKAINHVIFNQMEGSIDTGRMMTSLQQKVLKAGVRIHHGIEVMDVEKVNDHFRMTTRQGVSISSRGVIVTTNGFASSLLKNVDLKPARNQVLITKPIQGLKLNGTFHYNEGFVYFRNVGNRILLGGGRDISLEEERTKSFGENEKITQYLIKFMTSHIVEVTAEDIDFWWSGIMGVGESKEPIVQRTDNGLLCGIRMGGMGIALGAHIGKSLAEMT